MRYVNHKFGRACVHRPRREDRGKEGERERKKEGRERERGHERVAKRYERARRRSKGGLDATGGEAKEKKQVGEFGC